VAGDLVYFVIPAADPERGRSFYGYLFGWSFTPGSVPGAFNIEGPQEIESGRMAHCRDDQGTEFGLWTPQKSPEGGG
jgi:predicted enzyme related to lactoylglutathione lyase